MYAARMRNHLLSLLILVLPTQAFAQGASRLFPVGAETKVHAGAGQLASRGAPANFYNPANLAETEKTVEIYGELDVIYADYEYEYPGLDPVRIKIRTPAPFVGASFALPANVYLGVTFFPSGAGGGQKIEKLPTMKFADNADSDPVLLDVETGSKGVGVSASLGVAYKFLERYAAGMSVLYSQGTSTLKATESEGGGVLIESESKSQSHQLIYGLRGIFWQDRIEAVLTFRPPSRSKSKGRTEYPALGGGTDNQGTGKGPTSYGVATSVRVTERIIPFVEYKRTNWKELRKQGGEVVFDRVDVDYYDTDDVMAGVSYEWNDRRVTLAAGFFQSELGDGIMAQESDDGIELIGYEFQDFEAIGFTTYAAGYRLELPKGYLQTGATYTKGERSIPREARGYGNYELTYYSLVAGGIWRI